MLFEVRQLFSPLGLITVVLRGRTLRALEFEAGRARMLERLEQEHGDRPPVLMEGNDSGDVLRRLRAYFDGDLDAIAGIETDAPGTPFQRQVWAALRTIPAGRTLSYQELAAVVCRPAAVRAAGQANGRNPIAVVVPCHRVIGADGRLTGFGSGVWRKEWLLRHEGAAFVAERARRPRQAPLPLHAG